MSTPRGRRGRRPGRKPLGADARSQPVQVYVTPEMFARIGALALRKNLTRSDWGLAAFVRELEREASENDETRKDAS